MGNIAHFNIVCAASEFDRVLAFYLAALKPLGYKEMKRPVENFVGLGNGYIADFWIGAKKGCEKISIEDRKQIGCHFAFWGKDFTAVHAFHAAGLKAGGTDNGKAGYRPKYSKLYYGAFIIDPLGNNVEVMCIYPPWMQWWWWRSWLPGGKVLEPENRKED
ncbi:hypothetical protein EPUS_07711 [Endocarpon pusillum Z07020]|uniref:VOC domain-containing protein n=1 Tax=Endocarpon pusillum (strain Z07020 / HMAS-L-300199) TaxID=1263415 RepID=U1G590_ENDPU|nr:uncharacterized protein EPUS_07711 [Endocarpon pusillum Z07020]ERF72502.1 hypothetical protein EPUS_07711 [Endocarpon pusillum Z07020]